MNSLFPRVVLLLGLMVIVSVGEFLMKGKTATRWKEYLLLLGIGVAGAVCGILHDQLTVTVSPEYYRLGKGLDHENLRWGAVLLGLQSGFVAGMVLGAINLFVVKELYHLRTQFRYFGAVAAGAISVAVLGAALGQVVIPDSWLEVYGIPEEASMRFKLVAAEHYGLYLGAILGTAVAIVRSRMRALP